MSQGFHAKSAVERRKERVTGKKKFVCDYYGKHVIG